MSDTLETISTNISKKITYINKIVENMCILHNIVKKKSDADSLFLKINALLLSANNIKESISEYQLESVDILVNYYKHTRQNSSLASRYLEMYQTFVTNSGLVNQFDAYVQTVKIKLIQQLSKLLPSTYSKIHLASSKKKSINLRHGGMQQYKSNRHSHLSKSSANESECDNIQISDICSQIEDLIDQYAETSVRCRIKDVRQFICPDCSIKMTYAQNSSEMVCEKCGLSINVFGVLCEDESTSQDGYKKSKRGSYDPAKHCRFWIERIQARESVEIDQSIIDRIKQMSKGDGLYGRKLTCMHIREYLHQMKCTQYNEHVPYIRKLLTGISPPQLTERELQLINNYFIKVIRILKKFVLLIKLMCVIIHNY